MQKTKILAFIMAGLLALAAQTVTASPFLPPPPEFDGICTVDCDDGLRFAVDSPVAGGMMSVGGEENRLQFAIDAPQPWTLIYVLSDPTGYFASYDEALDAGDSFLGLERKVHIAFTINGADAPYAVYYEYAGFWYQAIQLLVDDTQTGLIKMQCAPSPVPVPGAAWLLGSGLLGLIALRRRGGQQ